MKAETVKKIFLGGSLLIILVLSAVSISQAQSTDADISHGDFHKDPHATPESITMLLFGTGLLGVAAAARRRLQKNAD